MNNLTKLSNGLAALGIMLFCVAAGGLLAMQGLGLMPNTMLPQPTNFALFMAPVFWVLAIAARVLAPRLG